MFPRNTWYVACTPDEIDEKPLGRQICGEHIVFYRADDGQVAALEDFCPHRGARLSLGSVCEGKLVCGYHGLTMGCDGKTISMPGQRVGGFPKIRSFPVVERYGFIWVWTGDAALADPAAIHHLEWADNPEWAYGGGLYHVDCDYRLMVDNLMDLTHETYVHSTSIGQKEIDETPVSTKTEGEQVVTRRTMENVMAPPFWRANLRGNHLPDDQPVDRWQVCRFTPPGHIMIEVGVALAGKGGIDAPADQKVYSIVVDFLTPETETSMWYFWGMARNFNVKDKALTAQIRDGQAKVFAEDTAVLEAQQRNLSLHPTRKLLLLNIDAGGVQSRKLLDKMLAAEQAAAPVAQAA
ncbi:aromatic ring-hydroxylating dioxygenase subunit alpha [Pseudorhodoferax sp. Leaf267]|uniref:aromatic ring-hydroxylating dioxygenase subunit alpha n=1 Tax=Pseudorhodoferax sp. Leaf267 TaxID=1736316 RepID=UPI0006F6ECE1|nr:aromatic ring-hydroxylating dioxygenase subunit alpha [Pseudorhodoferax sp. Leaf267]KQP18171.1 Rieske (2Fe-2S) protein [Pseudorhodoferax sp. Leaf267]